MDETPAEQGTNNNDRGLHGMATARFTAGSSDWNGIRANLAEMERKLGELQSQVDPSQRHDEVGQRHDEVGYRRDEVGYRHDEMGGYRHEVGHASLQIAQFPGQLHPSVAPGQILPAAQSPPAMHAQAAQVKQQIEDLLRVREMLRDSLRGVIGECERVLGQLERGEGATPALAAGTGAGTGAGGTGAGAGTGAGTGEPPSVSAPAGIALRPSVFQGSVSLRVGPLSDISQVDTLEIALLQVPGAEQVEIKEFSGRDAVAEIRLFQPVRLIEELHRVLPFSFEVTQGDASTLTLLAAVETVAASVQEA